MFTEVTGAVNSLDVDHNEMSMSSPSSGQFVRAGTQNPGEVQGFDLTNAHDICITGAYTRRRSKLDVRVFSQVEMGNWTCEGGQPKTLAISSPSVMAPMFFSPRVWKYVVSHVAASKEEGQAGNPLE